MSNTKRWGFAAVLGLLGSAIIFIFTGVAGQGKITVEVYVKPDVFGRDNGSDTATPHVCTINATISNRTDDHLTEAVITFGGQEMEKIESVPANTKRDVELWGFDPENGSCVPTAQFVLRNASHAQVLSCSLASHSESACQSAFVVTVATSVKDIAGLQQQEKTKAQQTFDEERKKQWEERGAQNLTVGASFRVDTPIGLGLWPSVPEHINIDDAQEREATGEFQASVSTGTILTVDKIHRDLFGLDDWYFIHASGSNCYKCAGWTPVAYFHFAAAAGSRVSTPPQSPNSQADAENPAAPEDQDDAKEKSSVTKGIFCGRPVARDSMKGIASGGAYSVMDGQYNAEIGDKTEFGVVDRDLVVLGESLVTYYEAAKFSADPHVSGVTCLCASGSVQKLDDGTYVFRKIDAFGIWLRDEAACKGYFDR